MATLERIVPNGRVSVDGAVLELEQKARLEKIRIELGDQLLGRCELVFFDPRLALTNGELFGPGAAVKVELGYASRLTPVFEGEVTALEPRFRRDLPLVLHVICLDRLHRLSLSPSTRALDDVDDAEVVQQIAQSAGLQGEAPASTREHLLQANVSDAALLRRIAQKHGGSIRLEGKKLVVGPPAGDEIRLTPESGLQKLKVRMKAGGQIGEVVVRGWDAGAKREVVGRATPAGEAGEGARAHGGDYAIDSPFDEENAPDASSAEERARSRLQRLAEAFITLKLDLAGEPRAVPGAAVRLEGFGPADGTWRIEDALHEFWRYGYRTQASAVRTAKKRPPRPAQAQEPPTSAWIEVVLLDAAGRPVGGQQYRVETADGQVREGRLDAQGRAHLTGVRPGSNRVSFPGYSGEWRRI